MSNKYLLPLIVAISILFTGAVALIQSRSSNSKFAIVSISSVVGGGSSTIFSSSQVVSSSSNSNLESSPSKIQESTQSQTLSVQSYAPSSINQLQVEVLDSNNPPKYITDYLTCQKTSPTKEYGLLVNIEDGKLEYKCPKSLEYYGCEKNLEWGDWTMTKGSAPGKKYVEGWTCDVPAFGRSTNYCMYNFGVPVEELNLQTVKDDLIAEIPSRSKCVVILKKINSSDLIKLKGFKSPRAGSFSLITIN
jgi:hypothetical protein